MEGEGADACHEGLPASAGHSWARGTEGELGDKFEGVGYECRYFTGPSPVWRIRDLSFLGFRGAPFVPLQRFCASIWYPERDVLIHEDL